MLSRVSLSAASAVASRSAVSFSSASSSAAGLLRRRVAVAASAAAPAPAIISPVSGLDIPTAATIAAARGFSSSSSSSSSSSLPNATASIPTRHSRHLPRPICTDPAELESTTSQLLASRPGSLFTYEFAGGSSASSNNSNKADEYEAGLVRSDVTTQKFEWALGGHAARIPGTTVAAKEFAVASGNESDNSEHLDLMVQLLERIEEEGRIYVELRARVLNQQYSDSDNTVSDNVATDSSDSSSSDSSDSDSDSESDADAAAQTQSKSQSAWRIQSLINRYGAAPGPSVHMYDALLDAVACCAEAEGKGSKTAMEYLTLARSVYERVMARHHADGGPNANNRLTMPTLITYNAVLRTCAAVEYDGGNDGDDRVRDAALDLAFLVYDALNTNSQDTATATSTSNAVSKGRSSKRVGIANTTNMPQRNSATYVHMLHVIAKYLPPSSTRGNVAYGLWLSCTGHDGVLDDKVIRAYIEANTRDGSNGQQYDQLVAKLTAGADADNTVQQENGVLRQNWWRNRKSRRMGMNAEGY